MAREYEHPLRYTGEVGSGLLASLERNRKDLEEFLNNWCVRIEPDGTVNLPLGSHVNLNDIWHAGNDGPGSTLDADTLDGSHAAAFATTGHDHDADYVELAGDTMTGPLQLPAGSAATTALGVGEDDTGFYRSGAGATAFSSNGTGQVIWDDGIFKPVTDNDVDIGSSVLSFKNIYCYKYYDDGGNAVAQGFETYSKAGAVAVATGALKVMFPFAVTIVGCRAMVGTAPTGASLIVDVHKDGTTIYTTQANRPTITATNTDSGSWSAPDVTALAANSYLTVDVDQVGSTIAGSNLTVMVWWKRLA